MTIVFFFGECAVARLIVLIVPLPIVIKHTWAASIRPASTKGIRHTFFPSADQDKDYMHSIMLSSKVLVAVEMTMHYPRYGAN